MTSINNNRVSLSLDEQTLADIKAAFQTINNNLPFLTGLTSDERNSLLRTTVSNKQFVEDAIMVFNNYPDIFPAFVNGAEVNVDNKLHSQLDELLVISSLLNIKIEDTQLVAGDEAYSGALSIYRQVQSAEKSGVPGAAAALKILSARFSKQGPSENKEKDTTQNS